MNHLFKEDSHFMLMIRRFFSLVSLNIVWFICCIPLVTIGASTVALYTAIIAMRKDNLKEGEETVVLPLFFKTFKKEFKQSTVLTLILFACILMCIADIWCAFGFTIAMPDIVKYLCFLPAVLYALISVYVFPLQAKFSNTVAMTLKNAVLIALSNMHVSISVAVVNLVPLLFFMMYPALFVETSIIWIVGGTSAIAWLSWLMLDRVFEKYIEPEQEENKS